ncbi:hypothetical protein QBC35DRAFT_395877 [Podospora australis]|uniref:Uncharacterized protein n=1 Tax=Podospora australis TaxID=1536484 RepID=A0AAN6WI27_9PEZI|nr:hypothetical protein QBC35DRAFT_395877 [Podospora australis]
MTFHNDPRFKSVRTLDEVTKAWSIYGLPHSGFVHLSQDEILQYPGLIPNQHVVATGGNIDNVYMISAFHGLHCLQSLQRAFAIVTDNSTNGNYEFALHANHCFNYLRQVVLCAADFTLEGPDMIPEPGESPLRGWGVEHKCWSWKKMEEWRDRHAI